jgi:phosphopantothenoylcysteine decarboxylase / phosphopantothenate---cysteine ligase
MASKTGKEKDRSRKIVRRAHRVLLLVTGCIQAEAVPRLLRLMQSFPRLKPIEIHVCATEAALQFLDTRAVKQIIGHKVFVHHGDRSAKFPVPHINLPEWADLVLVYPASANTIAKCAHGISDSLVLTILLAAKRPVYFGPTMNDAMFKNPLTQRNIGILKKIGHKFIRRELFPVRIRSTGQVQEKMYVSERSVLRTCAKLFMKDPLSS